AKCHKCGLSFRLPVLSIPAVEPNRLAPQAGSAGEGSPNPDFSGPPSSPHSSCPVPKTPEVKNRPVEARSGNSVSDVLQVLFEPIIEYSRGMPRATNWVALGDYIASKKGDAANLVKFMLGSIFVASIIESLLPSGNAIQATSFPLANELLTMLLWVFASL